MVSTLGRLDVNLLQTAGMYGLLLLQGAMPWLLPDVVIVPMYWYLLAVWAWMALLNYWTSTTRQMAIPVARASGSQKARLQSSRRLCRRHRGGGGGGGNDDDHTSVEMGVPDADSDKGSRRHLPPTPDRDAIPPYILGPLNMMLVWLFPLVAMPVVGWLRLWVGVAVGTRLACRLLCRSLALSTARRQRKQTDDQHPRCSACGRWTCPEPHTLLSWTLLVPVSLVFIWGFPWTLNATRAATTPVRALLPAPGAIALVVGVLLQFCVWVAEQHGDQLVATLEPTNSTLLVKNQTILRHGPSNNEPFRRMLALRASFAILAVAVSIAVLLQYTATMNLWPMHQTALMSRIAAMELWATREAMMGFGACSLVAWDCWTYRRLAAASATGAKPAVMSTPRKRAVWTKCVNYASAAWAFGSLWLLSLGGGAMGATPLAMLLLGVGLGLFLLTLWLWLRQSAIPLNSLPAVASIVLLSLTAQHMVWYAATHSSDWEQRYPGMVWPSMMLVLTLGWNLCMLFTLLLTLPPPLPETAQATSSTATETSPHKSDAGDRDGTLSLDAALCYTARLLLSPLHHIVRMFLSA